MPRSRRRWDSQQEDDPLSGLVNLFDLWMVFSIALLVIFAGSIKKRPSSAPDSAPPDPGARIAVNSTPRNLDRVRVSRDQLTGTGEKLGTAYRLPSGEVVCVPD
ncbi:DUF2149 domain-containing protein [Aquisphaera insulae]|uniref:DUF2149 domain-containing protein n=1 Tax=Aquisphaera insulae TaxID=2712864 RepID=UPI0013EE2960|nr:DUF2149 domain-containing protein [Aquisphaera insulae]